MLKLALALTLLPLPSLASECLGETYGGIVVKVEVNTMGTMGSITGGRVTITEKDGAERSYAIKAEEISQFFEADSDTSGEGAIVGLSAYLDAEYPVSIRYVGKNYENPLRSLKDPSRRKQGGNYMRVWKGPGFAGGDQHSFADVVCSIVIDV